MTETVRGGALEWQEIERPDGVRIEQARARNNSWYLIVPERGIHTLRYASQSGNAVIAADVTPDAARLAAERHADRYDTRA